MEPLVFLLTASTLYATAISVGYGRDFDDRIVTRPIVVAVGVALVVMVKEWGNWQEIQEWAMWFGIAGIPQVVRVAIIHIKNEKRATLKLHGISGTVPVQKEVSK